LTSAETGLAASARVRVKDSAVDRSTIVMNWWRVGVFQGQNCRGEIPTRKMHTDWRWPILPAGESKGSDCVIRRAWSLCPPFIQPNPDAWRICAQTSAVASGLPSKETFVTRLWHARRF